MSCACENKRLAGERERMRRLAKGAAEIEGKTVALFAKEDGTYGFSVEPSPGKHIVEYITPY